MVLFWYKLIIELEILNIGNALRIYKISLINDLILNEIIM